MNTTHSPIKIILLLLIVVAGGYWFFTHSSPNPTTDVGIAKVIADKILVPNDVPPRISKITTLEQLRSQTFVQAALGDVLVAYPDIVVLYRPSIDKIITMGTLEPTMSARLFGGEAATPAVTTNGDTSIETPSATTVAPTPTEPINVEIRNGTATSGLAKKLSEKLTVDSMIKVPATGNARDQQYAKTTIVNLTGAELPSGITSVINGAEVVTALPTGEKAPETDVKVLVIIGSDITSKVSGL